MCHVCNRANSGLGWYDPRLPAVKRIPYKFCSKACLDKWRDGFMLVNKRAVEVKAIEHVRRTALYQILVNIGAATAFDNCTVEQMDYAIEEIVAGFSGYVQKYDDSIPF